MFSSLASNDSRRTVVVAIPSILTRLKSETASQHMGIEGRVESFLTGDSSSYRRLLELFYGFVQPAEERLAENPSLRTLVPDLSNRMRALVLERDLISLGMSPDALQQSPRCQRIPQLDAPAQALGYLYVLEGSTLGGQFIVRQIEQLNPELPREWFRSYGSDLGLMWRRFRTLAESYALANPEEADAICESARNTFTSLHEWFGGGENA